MPCLRQRTRRTRTDWCVMAATRRDGYYKAEGLLPEEQSGFHPNRTTISMMLGAKAARAGTVPDHLKVFNPLHCILLRGYR